MTLGFAPLMKVGDFNPEMEHAADNVQDVNFPGKLSSKIDTLVFSGFQNVGMTRVHPKKCSKSTLESSLLPGIKQKFAKKY